MTIFQIIILILVAYIILKAARRLMKKELSVWLFIFWVSLWGGAAILTVFPRVMEQLALWLGIGRGVDLVIYLSLLLIFYLLFKINLRQQALEKKLVALVRQNAIDNAKTFH